jgi:zinc and cadmium transporter
MTHLLSSSAFAALASVLLVSALALTGLLFLALSERILQNILLPLVSFATGAMLGNVFGHIMPEVMEESSDMRVSLLLILGGMLLSFVVEKFIHWHHCHHMECEHHHVHPVGGMVLIGESVHNFLDGALIASAYLVDLRIGLATTIAVVLHEIPQEIGNFSVLVHSGLRPMRALLLNCCSALGAVAGAIFILIAAGALPHLEFILLPIAAGNFLYIAGADLIPELHKESRAKQGIVQLLLILSGIGLMIGLARGADPHPSSEPSMPPRSDAVRESR